MRRVGLYTVLVLGTLTVIFLLWQFRQAIIIFLFSLAVAAATRPIVEALMNMGINRILALLIIYFGIFGIIAAILFAAGESFLRDFQELVDGIALTYDRIWSTWFRGTQIQQTIVRQIPPPNELYQSFLGEGGSLALQTLVGFTAFSFNFISQFFMVIVLSIYWSIDRIYFERLWLSLLPVELRARARDIWRDIETGMGLFIRSEIIQSILAGGFLGLGFWLIGLPFYTTLAITIAILRLIPWLGAILSLLLMLIVGLTVSPAMAVLAPVYTTLIIIFLEVIVEPRFFNQRKFSSVLLVLFLIALSDSFGIAGIIIAPPLVAAIQILFHHLLTPSTQPDSIDSVRRIADLEKRINEVYLMAENIPEEMSPQVANMLERLDQLVDKANTMLANLSSRP